MSNVTVNFVDTPMSVNVDLSLLTWGDLLRIQKAMGGTVDESTAETLLNTVLSKVTGQDAEQLPAMVVSEVLRGVMAKVQGSGTEKN